MRQKKQQEHEHRFAKIGFRTTRKDGKKQRYICQECGMTTYDPQEEKADDP